MIFDDDFSDKNWRDVLNSKYSEPEYKEMLSNSQSRSAAFNISTNFGDPMAAPSSSSMGGNAAHAMMKSYVNTGGGEYDPYAPVDEKNELFEKYEGIRFPPVKKIDIPQPVNMADFTIDDLTYFDNVDLSAESVEVEEAYAGLKFMEAMLKTFASKLVELRQSVIDHAVYLHSLQRPANGEEKKYIESTIYLNLSTLNEELQELLAEMTLFQATKLHEMIDASTIPDPNHPIHQHKNSLITRSGKLCEESTLSIMCTEQLYEYTNSLVRFPEEAVPISAGFHTSWESQVRLQHKVKRSQLSLEYLVFADARQIPICNQFYQFLQDPPAYDNRLIIEKYKFAKGEFAHIMEFFVMQEKNYHEDHTKGVSNPALPSGFSLFQNIIELTVFDSEFNDQDAHALATYLHRFTSLRILNLARNRIAYSGMASLATNIFEHKSCIKILMLNDNRIDTESANLLGQIFGFMPELVRLSLSGNAIKDRGCYAILKASLNPLRKAFFHLPKLEKAADDEWMAQTTDGGDDHDDSDVEEETVAGDDVESDDFAPAKRTTRRYPLKCYLSDFFHPIYNVEKQKQIEQDQLNVDYRWLNDADEEFDMCDYHSEYSSDADIPMDSAGLDNEAMELQSKAAGTTTSASAAVTVTNSTVLAQQSVVPLSTLLPTEILENKMTYKDKLKFLLQAPAEDMEEIKSPAEIIRSYPKLVQKILKHRLKINAIILFRKRGKRGKTKLSSLALSSCQLTPSILPMLTHVFHDNQYLCELDVSHNPTLLAKTSGCKNMADLIEFSSIANLNLRNTGLKEGGLLVLSKAITKSDSLNRFDLSHNHLGPTAANIIANLNKIYHVDTLAIAPGSMKSAPYLGRDFQDWNDWNLDDNARELYLRSKFMKSKKQSVEGDSDEDRDSTYEDEDVYEGEDEDGISEHHGTNDHSTYAGKSVGGSSHVEEHDDGDTISVLSKRVELL